MTQKIFHTINLRAILSVSTLFVAGLAQAGVWTSGGGQSVVCRAETGQIKSAELLDLYEARVEWGLTYETSRDSFASQVAALGPKVQSAIPIPSGFVLPETRRIVSTLHLLPKGTALQLIDDAASVVAPEGCKIEQLAAYQPNQTVLINGEIWSALDETNKAALIYHEAVFRYLRDQGATESSRARHFVGLVFSGATIEAPDAGIPGNALWCLATQADGTAMPRHDYTVGVYTDASGNLIVQFMTIGNIAALSKTSVNLGRVPFSIFNSFVDIDYNLEAPLESRATYALDSAVDGGVPLQTNLSVEELPDRQERPAVDASFWFAFGSNADAEWESIYHCERHRPQ